MQYKINSKKSHCILEFSQMLKITVLLDSYKVVRIINKNEAIKYTKVKTTNCLFILQQFFVDHKFY
jgi:hypothetical protein